MRSIRYTADGFTTSLVKPEGDGWSGQVEPLRTREDDVIASLYDSYMVFRLVEAFAELIRHLIRVAPWAPWRLSLSRGGLELRKRGRRHRQPLAALCEVVFDDDGLSLHFDDGRSWSIPPQPAEVVDLQDLGEHLRRASCSARVAVAHDATELKRARVALRDLRAAPERER